MPESIGNPLQSTPPAAETIPQLRVRLGPDGDVSLFAYWFLLKSYLRPIAVIAAIVAVSTFLATTLMTKRYQAIAIIRPIPQSLQQSSLMGGMVGGFLGGSTI